MLKSIFGNPKRLFVCLAIVVGLGIYAGFTLPVSMYPATSKPSVRMWVPYGTYSSDKFREDFGKTIESRITKITNSEIKVSETYVFYEEHGAYFEIDFDWNTPFDLAKKEVDAVAASITGVLPKEISDGLSVWQRNRNSGFFAASVYSKEIGLKELYDITQPILQPKLDKILDAEQAVLWNPERYSINVKLYPDKLAQYGIYPSLIKRQIKDSLYSFTGSNLKLGNGNQNQRFEVSASVKTVEELADLKIRIGKKIVFLKELAEVDYGKDLHRERSFKTNGLSSLILFARPKSGANVKKMSEDILRVMAESKLELPKSLKTKLIVDPAAAINKSILNLIKDVFVAAAMAVLVLYLFIGGIKNVGTAAIEIPLSMIISFIAMKMAGMNLNLISLGGLALAAGMNVDASVVVLENIFKHRQNWLKQGKSCTTFKERLSLVHTAVSEVALPIMLSITTTLIVFIPMAFTSDLTNAILGDLARAVIFSHAVSGFIALIVVPTVRVLMLKSYSPTIPPLEKPYNKFQAIYEKALIKVLRFKFNKITSILVPFLLLGLLVITILPNLPKEVIGKPGSDWIYMSINAYDTKSGRHMENIMQEAESKALALIGGKVDYTWFEKNSRNNGQLMFKLFNRSDMKEIEKILKDNFENTPSRYFNIGDWNPAELPLPNEKHFDLNIKGNKSDIFITASKVNSFLREENSYERFRHTPSLGKNYYFNFSPNKDVMLNLNANNYNVNLQDIAEVSKISESPVNVGVLDYNKSITDIKLSLHDKRYTNADSLMAYPLNLNNVVIPLSALGSFETIKRPGTIFVKDGQPLIRIRAYLDENKKDWEKIYESVSKKLEAEIPNLTKGTKSTIQIKYPQQELKDSLSQLTNSLIFSLVLIFFILWMQFQSVKQVSVIMMTIPLGIIGVLTSLWLFDSYLSLNSALGIILLNGITVNNSILLTEVTNSLRAKGLRGEDLIITAVRKRLRPILITSLTTILGMFPVALGLGDGGKILQPLGIAVTCGLFLATSLSIFIVPTLLLRREENLASTEDFIGEIITQPNQDQTQEVSLI